MFELGQVLLHHVIFALVFLERDDVEMMLLGKLVDLANELFRHRSNGRRRGDRKTEMAADELRHAPFGLKRGDAPIQVHSIHALDLEDHALSQDLRNALWHAGSGLRVCTATFGSPIASGDPNAGRGRYHPCTHLGPFLFHIAVAA